MLDLGMNLLCVVIFLSFELILKLGNLGQVLISLGQGFQKLLFNLSDSCLEIGHIESISIRAQSCHSVLLLSFLKLELIVTLLGLEFSLEASNLLGLLFNFMPGFNHFLLKFLHGHLFKFFISSLLSVTPIQLVLLYLLFKVLMN